MCDTPFPNNLRVPQIRCGGQLSVGLSSATEFGKQAKKPLQTTDENKEHLSGEGCL